MMTVSVMIAVTGLSWIAYGNPPATVTATDHGQLVTPGLQEVISGCTGRMEVTDTQGIPDAVVPATTPSGTTPYHPAPPGGVDIPVRGFMHPHGIDTPTVTTKPADPWAVLRDLWDGHIAVYYTPTASSRQVAALESFAERFPDLNLIVTPWNPNAGPGGFSDTRGIAIAGWGALEYCGTASYPVVRDFAAAVQPDAPGLTGAAPPVHIKQWDNNKQTLAAVPATQGTDTDE